MTEVVEAVLNDKGDGWFRVGADVEIRRVYSSKNLEISSTYPGNEDQASIIVGPQDLKSLGKALVGLGEVLSKPSEEKEEPKAAKK